MKILSVIELILTLLEGAAAAFNKMGLEEEVKGVLAAIAELEKVKGSAITKPQVDSFRIEPIW